MDSTDSFVRLWGRKSYETYDTRSNWGGQVVDRPYDAAAYFWKGTRNTKRVRPEMYRLPVKGTASNSMAYRFQQTRARWYKSSTPPIVSTNGPFYRSSDHPLRNAEKLLALQDVTGFQKALWNRAISEIVEGKSQLSVDLLELGKTRTMVAEAFLALRTGIRDVRRGQPLKHFVKSLQKEGWRGTAGKRFLEYTYGWVPTVKGAFETSDVLGESWSRSKIYCGTVKHSQRISGQLAGYGGYSVLDFLCRAKGVLHYQFSVSNPKLLTLSRLGLTNPAMIAWELLPWSFVLDWACGFGDYLEKLDWSLGLSDIHQQTSVHRMCVAGWSDCVDALTHQPGAGILVASAAQRQAPSRLMTYTWRGIKHPFKSKNAETRLAVSLALLNQQRDRMMRYR